LDPESQQSSDEEAGEDEDEDENGDEEESSGVDVLYFLEKDREQRARKHSYLKG